MNQRFISTQHWPWYEESIFDFILEKQKCKKIQFLCLQTSLKWKPAEKNFKTQILIIWKYQEMREVVKMFLHNLLFSSIILFACIFCPGKFLLLFLFFNFHSSPLKQFLLTTIQPETKISSVVSEIHQFCYLVQNKFR